MKKTKIAIFDLTGCEGCEFHLLSLNELLLDFFQDFEIINWRLLSEQKKADFDVAFIEGAVTTQEQIKLLKEIRETSKVVVALGACAISGNFFAELTPERRKIMVKKIYDKDYNLKAEFLAPVEKFIKVDAKIPGCPANIELLKNFLKQLREKKITSKAKEVSPPDFTAKIEGHGTLKVNFQKKEVDFEVEESERLVEGLVLGKSFKVAPFMTSRICGICPIAHNICSLSAIENALGIKLTEETILLRRLLLASQVIKSHLLHLFFLVLPDYAGVKGAIELSKKYPAEFHLMLNIKRITEKILQTVGGQVSFPNNTSIGGFRKVPSKDTLLAIKASIFEVLDEAEDLIKIFASIENPSLKSDLKQVYVKPLDVFSYPLYPGFFPEAVKEIIQKESPAKLGVLKDNQVIRVGALSRLANNSQYLKPQASKMFSKFKPDFQNPFSNNLAQSIEILHFLEESLEIIDTLTKKNLKRAKEVSNYNLPKENASGTAYLEAPRGILIHQIEIDSQGLIVNYKIIPPTQINLAALKKDAQLLVEQNKKFEEKEIKKALERLIRAFDPCITCAVH